LLNKSPRVEDFFKLATTGKRPYRVGFDTCTITGLARFGEGLPISIEGCDAGRFSMFISEKMEAYPCSFMVEAGYKGIPLKGNSLKNIWTENPSFQRIRHQHSNGGCSSCTTKDQCLSGCPLFPEMNLCRDKCVSQCSNT
jgi:radical SAM protein with 4Fe4S-binding SPASM domain